MNVHSICPPPPLDKYVRSIWVFKTQSLPHALERVVPDGSMQLLVNLHEDELRWRFNADYSIGAVGVAGVFSSHFQIDTQQQRWITGVSFAPGGFGAFFDLPCHLLNNLHIDLAELVQLDALGERLAGLIDPHLIINHWIGVLTGWLDEDRVCPWTANALQALGAGQSVDSIARALQIDPRRFRHQFRASVGIGPKLFSRVYRLQCVMRAVACAESAPDWADLALRYGYFDQAHLIRDFRQIAGVTPGRYRPRDRLDWNHCPL